jgi:hypothetical protein
MVYAFLIVLVLLIGCGAYCVYLYMNNKSVKKDNEILSQDKKDIVRNVHGLADHEVKSDDISKKTEEVKNDIKEASGKDIDDMFDSIVSGNNKLSDGTKK